MRGREVQRPRHRNAARGGAAVGVERFVLISTDKAADPASVLGATKRLAEMVVKRARRRAHGLGSVRFGNVLAAGARFCTCSPPRCAAASR